MGSKRGQRRGAYRAPATAPAAPREQLPATATIDELLERVRRESTMRHPGAREVAVRALGGLLWERARLEGRSREGSLLGDEARAVSANAGSVRRMLELLGVVELVEPGTGDDGEGGGLLG